MNEDVKDKRKTLVIEVRKEGNETLSILDSMIDTLIASLHRKLAVDGELGDKDFKKLIELINSKKSMIDIKRDAKQESVLEGKSEEEIRKLAEAAMKSLGGGK